MTKFLPFAKQSIDEQDINAVIQALKQDYITRGATVQAFERAIADLVGADFAVAFSSGSSALYAAYKAAKVTSFDKIISTPNTFIATVAGGAARGATVHLVDINEYGNMDIDLLDEKVLAPMSRGKTFIVPVHFAGVAIDMQKLSSMIRAQDVVIIEDAAHALGSQYPDGTFVGSCAYSDMTIFSFHASKNIACGEGGMVTTNDPDLFSRLKQLRNSGIENSSSWYYEVTDISCNGHMTEMQAALGLSQLQNLSEFQKKKNTLISVYRELLENVPGIEPNNCDVDMRTHYHLFEVHIDYELFNTSRSAVMDTLLEEGIGSQYHYVPLYNHPVLNFVCKQKKELFPIMEVHFQKALSLPLSVRMEEGDVERVVTALRKAILQ